MIRVTVELISARGASRDRLLGVAEIGNDGTGTHGAGHYTYRLSDKARRLWKSGTVRDFPRKRLLAWDLLFRILRDAVGERNG